MHLGKSNHVCKLKGGQRYLWQLQSKYGLSVCCIEINISPKLQKCILISPSVNIDTGQFNIHNFVHGGQISSSFVAKVARYCMEEGTFDPGLRHKALVLVTAPELFPQPWDTSRGTKSISLVPCSTVTVEVGLLFFQNMRYKRVHVFCNYLTGN